MWRRAGLLSFVVGCGAAPAPATSVPTSTAEGSTAEGSAAEPVASEAVPEPAPDEPVASPGPRFVTVIAGYEATCALDDGGQVLCWGRGHGATPTRAASGVEALLGVASSTPCYRADGALQNCGGAPAGATELDVVWPPPSGCALVTGEVWCWDRSDPAVQIAGIGGAVELASGGRGGCVRDAAGSVTCWGQVIGDETPAAIALPAAAVSITAGSRHACAALADGRVACWGHGAEQGGPASHRSSLLDAELVAGLDDVVRVDGGESTTCAISRANEVRCWGGTVVVDAAYCARTVEDTTLTPIPALDGTVALTFYGSRGCALLASGGISCFGQSLDVGPGDGTTWDLAPSTQPRPIRIDTSPVDGCMSGTDRTASRTTFVHTSADASSVEYCMSSCVRVDVATGTFTTIDARHTSDAIPHEPAASVELSRAGRRTRACLAAEPERCRDLDVALRRGASAVFVDDTFVVLSHVSTDEDGNQTWSLAGYAEATGAELYARELETQTELRLASMGPFALLRDGPTHHASLALVAPRTGDSRRLADAHGDEIVLRLASDRWAITDEHGSHVELVAADGTSRNVEVGDLGEHASALVATGAVVLVGGGPSENYATGGGSVVVVDTETASVRARHVPPPCDPPPPADPCPWR